MEKLGLEIGDLNKCVQTPVNMEECSDVGRAERLMKQPGLTRLASQLELVPGGRAHVVRQGGVLHGLKVRQYGGGPGLSLTMTGTGSQHGPLHWLVRRIRYLLWGKSPCLRHGFSSSFWSSRWCLERESCASCFTMDEGEKNGEIDNSLKETKWSG